MAADLPVSLPVASTVRTSISFAPAGRVMDGSDHLPSAPAVAVPTGCPSTTTSTFELGAAVPLTGNVADVMRNPDGNVIATALAPEAVVA